MENRYLERRRTDGREEHERFSRYNAYLAKRDEIANHRRWQEQRQAEMLPYRAMNNDYRGGRGDYRGNDYTQYEHQSAFEIPHQDYRGYDRNGYDRNAEYYPPLRSQDYARGRGDMNYRNDYRGDYESGEKRWKDDLKELTEKLKKKDRFNIPKDQIINHAKNMGVKFDEFSEDEFYAVYLMQVSDYKNVSNEFRMYISMAKDWLEDDDIAVSPSEKLCIYYDDIILGNAIK